MENMEKANDMWIEVGKKHILILGLGIRVVLEKLPGSYIWKPWFSDSWFTMNGVSDLFEAKRKVERTVLLNLEMVIEKLK